MGKKKFIAETETFEYYRDQENGISMQRKTDCKLFPNDEVAKGELISDCLEGSIVKIAPIFVYDYIEILKENGKLLIEPLE